MWKKITDLSELLIGYLDDYDVNSSKKVMDEIDKSVGGSANYNAFDDKFAMVDALYNQTIKAMILNKANMMLSKMVKDTRILRTKLRLFILQK